MSGTASGWTPVGPAGGGRWELLVFCCIWLGLRARCAGIGTGKESGRMVFTAFWHKSAFVFQMYLIRSIKTDLYTNMINSDALYFCERRSEEVTSFF